MNYYLSPRLQKRFFTFLCFLALLSSCGPPSFEKKVHLVTNIIDGNTIEVDNGFLIGLTGINNSAESENFLRTNLINQRVRFVYDSGKREPVTNRNSKIHGYIVTFNRLSVNGELLKQKLATLNEDFLKDSLKIFRVYAGENSGLTNNTTSSEVREQPNTLPGSNNTFVSLINKVKSSVFTVYQINDEGEMTGLGTGFFISSDGIGVSNYHVFAGGSSFIVKTIDQKQFSVGQIISQNQQYDYIVFRISTNGETLPFLSFNHEPPLQGEEIFVVGNPIGLESTATKGIVSAIRTRYSSNDLIQIDAAISPGSSGSPVCNMAGKVIGIATFKIIVEGCELCNFAINANLLENALNGNTNN
jgi:serine protease Do